MASGKLPGQRITSPRRPAGWRRARSRRWNPDTRATPPLARGVGHLNSSPPKTGAAPGAAGMRSLLRLTVGLLFPGSGRSEWGGERRGALARRADESGGVRKGTPPFCGSGCLQPTRRCVHGGDVRKPVISAWAERAAAAGGERKAAQGVKRMLRHMAPRLESLTALLIF